MAIRWTSRLSLTSELDLLSGRRRQVWEAVANWPSDQPGPTIEDLARVTGLKECSICARLSELKGVFGGIHHPDKVCIAEGPLTTNRTGKQAITYIALGYRPTKQEGPQLVLEFY